MVDKAVKLSDKEFHDKNLEIVKRILYNINFPKKFVLGHIKKRLFNISSKNNNPSESSRNFSPESILCVPYIEGLSENRMPKIRRRVLRMSNIRHSTDSRSNVVNPTSEEGRFEFTSLVIIVFI